MNWFPLDNCIILNFREEIPPHKIYYSDTYTKIKNKIRCSSVRLEGVHRTQNFSKYMSIDHAIPLREFDEIVETAQNVVKPPKPRKCSNGWFSFNNGL